MINQMHAGIRLLLFFFTFLLFLEWLRPVEEVTDTSNMGYFIVYAALLVVLYAFKVSWKWTVPVSFFYMSICLYMLHYRALTMMEDESWLRLLFVDLADGIRDSFTADLDGLTPGFRTFLFLLIIWMLCYLLHYWVMVKQRLFLFLFLTFLYVTVLDTFTPYDGDGAIVRLVICGFAVLGALALIRLFTQHGLPYSIKKMGIWVSALAGMITLGVLVGFAAPKPQAIWPDPVAFIKSTSEKYGSDRKRIGYGVNDLKLGGDFIGDNSVVFTAKSPVRTNWKVEHKTVYTGKGWLSSRSNTAEAIYYDDENIGLYDYIGELENNESIAELDVEIDHGHIPYPDPMYIQSISVNGDEDPQELLYSEGTSRITPYEEEGVEGERIEEISIAFMSPTFYLDALRANGREDYDESYLGEYTQLPSSLPERVRDLAFEIVSENAESDSVYDQVKAIEEYLRGEKFTYSQAGVAYPAEGQDYVDQFLFETNIGYCDNFSTSMVVLLRSLGIPTRWVKGYTAGLSTYDSAVGGTVYEVTNNNAHSWPEVFFPNTGWVPFEPTKGFNPEARFLETFEQQEQEQNETEETERQEEERTTVPERSDEGGGTDKSFDLASMVDFLKESWKAVAGSVLALGILTAIIYRFRGKWVPRLWVIYYKRSKSDERFSKAYLRLLAELARFGIKRQEGQTLREYARYVDQFFGTVEMKILTAEYERILYSGAGSMAEWQEYEKTWEKMILKTIA